LLLLDGHELDAGNNVEWHEFPDGSRVFGWLGGTAKGEVSGNASPGKLLMESELSELESVVRVTGVCGTNSGPLNGADCLVSLLVRSRSSHTEWLGSEYSGTRHDLAAKQELVGGVDLGPCGSRFGSVGLASGDTWSVLGALPGVNTRVALVSGPDKLASRGISGGAPDDLTSLEDVLGESGVFVSNHCSWESESLDVTEVAGHEGPSVVLSSWVVFGALKGVIALEHVLLVTKVLTALDRV